MTATVYTTQLQAGLGMLDETRELLELWKPSMTTTQLYQLALDSGRFHSLSARRLRNIVAECFAPRYLTNGGRPARLLKGTVHAINGNEFRQLCLIYTCRANPIVADFVRDVYWGAYAAGRSSISNRDAREFVETANRDGRTTAPWSDTTVKRVGGYLTGTLADYGLLEPTSRGDRALLSYRVEPRVAGLLAYDLHFLGRPDMAILSSPAWSLFGLMRDDVVDLIRRLSLQNWFVYQSAADAVRLSWRLSTLEELVDAVCRGKL